MRFVPVALAAVLLAACATQEPQKPAAAPEKIAATEQAAPAAAESDKFAHIDETNIVDAQKAGFKIVNEKGRKLVCRRDHPTGTRLKEQTVCMTVEEWTSANRTAREALDKPIMRVNTDK